MKYENVLRVETIAELQAAGEFRHGQLARVIASANAPGGEAIYKWDASSTATDDSSGEGTTIQVTGQTLGRWLLQAGSEEGVNVTTATVTAAWGKRYTLNRAGGIAVTLPPATGSGKQIQLVVGTTFTTSATVKVPDADNILAGVAVGGADDAGGTAKVWSTAATSDTITLTGTTTGGYVGDMIIITDVLENVSSVQAFIRQTGSEATPFSATVS